MWQYIATIVIVVAALAYLSHRIYKTLTAKKPQCDGCGLGKDCCCKCEAHGKNDKVQK
ncbi:MAG: hypothetical protein II569_02255 [Paludibacteraceae bacterium]|jgi:hypothetical protein|nr:hypothetical protein [Paludibacteraceae bacterium]MBQ2590545.1 hypothetical protein [Paludibacteraceae bacterium]